MECRNGMGERNGMNEEQMAKLINTQSHQIFKLTTDRKETDVELLRRMNEQYILIARGRSENIAIIIFLAVLNVLLIADMIMRAFTG